LTGSIAVIEDQGEMIRGCLAGRGSPCAKRLVQHAHAADRLHAPRTEVLGLGVVPVG
jgi:hypothetical protein